MALSTLPIPGNRAFELGLVDKITEEPERALHRPCARITKLPPQSLKGLKRMAEEMAPLDEKSLKRGTQWTSEPMTAAHTRNGIEDFLRCRDMPWKGRTCLPSPMWHGGLPSP